MYPLTNTLQCDPNSKDSLWLPNCETMEHDICDLVCFISWHPLWWRGDFCLCAFGEQFFPIDAEQCVYSSCHKFHTVNSDKLTVLHNVAKVPTVFVLITQQRKHSHTGLCTLVFQSTQAKLIPQRQMRRTSWARNMGPVGAGSNLGSGTDLLLVSFQTVLAISHCPVWSRAKRN